MKNKELKIKNKEMTLRHELFLEDKACFASWPPCNRNREVSGMTLSRVGLTDIKKSDSALEE